MTLRGQILVSRTDDDLLPSVCTFKNVPECMCACLPAYTETS